MSLFSSLYWIERKDNWLAFYKVAVILPIGKVIKKENFKQPAQLAFPASEVMHYFDFLQKNRIQGLAPGYKKNNSNSGGSVKAFVWFVFRFINLILLASLLYYTDAQSKAAGTENMCQK